MPSLVFALTLTAPPSTPEPGRERRGHRGQVGSERRPLGDDRAVRLGEGEAAAADQLVRRAEELHRIRVLPLRIGVRKQLPDVPGPGGAQNGVGQRMRHRVGVRMPGQALRVRNDDAPEDERAARDEAVGVVADPHASHAATGSSMTL